VSQRKAGGALKIGLANPCGRKNIAGNSLDILGQEAKPQFPNNT
jgi:hypothetical protein